MSSGPLPLVLVAVGTDHHRFDRLVSWVDHWLESGGARRADVLVQHGSAAAPRVARGVPLIDHAGLQDVMERACAVVCHGGPATITEARRHGHLPICVPRDPSRDEHVDDHQLLFATRMDQAGVVRMARGEAELHALLDEALAYPDRFAVGAENTLNNDVSGLERLAELVSDVLPAGDDPRVPVLYVGGLGRSGSTLLERAIAQVDGLACVGEVVHLWERGLRDDELCGCGARFSECSFWQRVGKSAFGGWDRLDVDAVLALKASVDRKRYAPLLLSPPAGSAFARRLRAYGALLTRLYRAVLEVSGAEMVVDASKHASTALVLRSTPGVDLTVLHVVRDSPAVAYAWTKRIPRPEAGPGEYMATWTPMQTAVHWASENALLDSAARRGTPTRLVRYEDFVRSPRETLAGLLEFLGRSGAPGTDPLPFVDGDELRLDPSHTVAGNPMRFASGTLRVVADDAWRERLPSSSRTAVAALTAPLRRRYDYLGGRR